MGATIAAILRSPLRNSIFRAGRTGPQGYFRPSLRTRQIPRCDSKGHWPSIHMRLPGLGPRFLLRAHVAPTLRNANTASPPLEVTPATVSAGLQMHAGHIFPRSEKLTANGELQPACARWR